MEAIKQLITAELEKSLYPKNEFYKSSKVDAGGDADVETVTVGQAGTGAEVIENPAPGDFPLAISDRTDDVKTYPVDLIATKPTKVTWNNQLLVSYDKRQDVIDDHRRVINTRVADKIAYNWMPTEAANIVRTSGDPILAKLTGATGNRKAFKIEDWIEALRVLNNMDLMDENYQALVSANFLAEIRNAGIKEFLGSDKLSTALLEKGAVASLLGVPIWTRSRVCRFDNAGTPVKKIYTAANAATDNDSCLIWHPRMVRRAEGKLKPFANIDEPTLLGSYFNGAVRAGGTTSRLDQAGVVAIVQAAAA